jgi:AcrR family transcriptional regulator
MKKKTRQNIVLAACEFYKYKGVRNVTMDELTNQRVVNNQ